jgi:hypothetical protein
MKLRYLIFAALLICAAFTVSCGEHEHSFGEWSVEKEPTCTGVGAQTRICTECGAVDELEIAALGHSLSSAVTAPTCTERGFTHYECESCDYESDGDYVEPTGHTLVALSVTEPTCTARGFTHFKCSVCASESDGDFVDMLEHRLVALAVTEPTCTEQGFTHYGCENCDYEKDDDYVKELGHDHKATRYYPTLSSDGYVSHLCHCGDSYEDSRIAYGDIFTTAYTDNTQPLKRGDMILYRRSSGVYVLHRIYQERNGSYDLVGDGQVGLEPGIRREQVFAIAKAVRRNGKLLRKGSFLWEFFEHVWLPLLPFRSAISGLYRHIKAWRKRK